MPEYICDYCGTKFFRKETFDWLRRPYKHHFCNKICSGKFQKGNPNYEDLTNNDLLGDKRYIEKICGNCKRPFKVHRAFTSQNYCSVTCKNNYLYPPWKYGLRLLESLLIVENKRILTKTCPVCGKQFGETRKTNRIYCSSKCSKDQHDAMRYEYKLKRYLKQSKSFVPNTEYGLSCCSVLKTHAELLKDDPERLSTDFIKSLSGCECINEVKKDA